MSWDINNVKGLKLLGGGPNGFRDTIAPVEVEGVDFDCEGLPGTFAHCEGKVDLDLTVTVSVPGAAGVGTYAGVTIGDTDTAWVLLHVVYNWFHSGYHTGCAEPPSESFVTGGCAPDDLVDDEPDHAWTTAIAVPGLINGTFTLAPTGVAPTDPDFAEAYLKPPSTLYTGDPTGNDVADYLWPVSADFVTDILTGSFGAFGSDPSLPLMLNVLPYLEKKTRRVAIV